MISVLPRRIADATAPHHSLVVRPLPFSSPRIEMSMIWSRRPDNLPAPYGTSCTPPDTPPNTSKCGRWLREIVSGVTDVATFLVLGDVFTSAMTGNTALLGIALSQGRILSATRSFSALLGFTLGAAVAALIYLRRRRDRPAGIEEIRPLLWTEIFCLGVFAVILTFAGRPDEAIALYALILLSAIG